MNLLAQQEHFGGVAGILDKAPTDEIMVMFVVFVVFSSLILITTTFFVTNTIRSIKVASINAQLTEKLVQQGVPHEQVERLVRANSKGIKLPNIQLPSRWRKAQQPASTMPGKPVGART